MTNGEVMDVIKKDGLKKKYIIFNSDGSDVPENAEYFVLRLDDGCNDKKHLSACRDAVMQYAERIKDHLPELSSDIFSKYCSKSDEDCLFFDNALERQRRFLGMSLSEASEKIGCSKPHLWEIEKGRVLSPSCDLVLAFSRVYELDANFLLELFESNKKAIKQESK